MVDRNGMSIHGRWNQNDAIGCVCAVVVAIILSGVIAGIAHFSPPPVEHIWPVDQAFREGQSAALSGVPAEACPYTSAWVGADMRQAWLNGWIEGYKQREKRP